VIRKPRRSLILAFSVLALFSVALVLVLRPARAPYLDLLREGDERAAHAERTAAVALYREAARLQPGDPTPHFRMAQVYLDWGRTGEALAALSEAERLGAGQANGVRLERLWVEAHVAAADWHAVVAHARQLLRLVPADRDARCTLAYAYVQSLDWDAARAEYEPLLQAGPADSLAHERLGALLIGDDASALQHLFAAQTDLADQLLVVLNEPGAADDPAYAAALLGRTLFEAGEWALAVRQFERALLHNADYPGAHAYLGYALDQAGLPNEAGPHLLQAVALAPDSAVAHTFLGLHYDRLGDFPAARAEYEAAYDLDPDNPATCVEIGQTWVAEGRYVAAEMWLLEAVSLRPDDPALWEVLARFYLGHTISADELGVEATEKLVELSPDDARACDLRGWAAFQVGDYATAQDALLRAISLDPTVASVHYHLGLLWDAQGDHQKAQEAFVRALDLDTTGELVPLVKRAMGGAP
jgi:Flp pilus assembly protein TadD